MDLDVKNIQGKSVGKISVPDEVFAVELNEGLLHDVIKAYRANRRQGTHATKTRSFVSGTGKKPFKQKGSGGARQGTLRGPHQPGGAVVHGPQPRDYTQELNKKAKKLAVRVALSDKARHGKLIVVDDFAISTYSTKQVIKLLGVFETKSALLADERRDDFLYRSARNIYKSDCVSPLELNAEDILRHDTLIVSQNAVKILNARFVASAE
jgi:large subunit ribosomal protein L4